MPVIFLAFMSMTITPPSFPFDQQAGRFDRESGLPAAAKPVAKALLEWDRHGTGLLLEIGIGTGEIGVELAAITDYLGVDLSLPMLEQARARFRQAGLPLRLAQADGNRTWPVRDASVGLVFLSRAAHLLSPAHLVGEVLRSAHPAGIILVLGRIRRQEDSLRNELRREMRRLLAASGISGRRGEEATRQLNAALAAHGGTALPSRIAATWPVREKPAAALAAWRGKPGLAGVALDETAKHQILDRLECWALERYGNLEAGHDTEESYELTAIRLPSRK